MLGEYRVRYRVEETRLASRWECTVKKKDNRAATVDYNSPMRDQDYDDDEGEGEEEGEEEEE